MAAATQDQAMSDIGVDLGPLTGLLERYPKEAASLVMLLQDIQAHYRYLPRPALRRVADALGVPLAQVYAVATFYKVFSLEPKGEHTCRVCAGTACHVRGAPLLVDEAERLLGIAPGETTDDLSYSLDVVNCVGACAMAPLVVVDEKYHGNVKPSRMKKLLGGRHAD